MDFDEIGSEMSESFDEFIVEFKASVRAEIAKRNVNFKQQLLSGFRVASKKV